MLDEMLLDGASMAELKKARKESGVRAHLYHLKKDHGIPWRRKGRIYQFDTDYLMTKTRHDMDTLVASDIESLKAEEGAEEYFEGGKRERLVNFYERDPRLRTQAILHHGKKCIVCKFDFEKVYGERGCGYIEVHHLRPVSNLRGKEKVDPKTDMTVLCSNCHRMIHRFRDKVLSPEELKRLISLL